MSTNFDTAQEPTKHTKMKPNDPEGDSASAAAPSVAAAAVASSSSPVSLTPAPVIYSPAPTQAGRPLSSLPAIMAAHVTEWTTSVVNIINDVTLRDFVTIANPPVCTSIWTYGAGFFEETNYPLADYDFHVVITGRLSYATQVALDDYNKKFHKEKGIDVDAYYILDSAARALPDPPSLVTREGKMDDYPVDDAWGLHRAHVWAGRYTTTYGADPQTFIAPVDYTQLQQSAMQLIHECIPRAAPASNNGCGTPYGTLQITRLIYSAVTKNFVVSKAAAAQWALTNDDMLPYRPQIAAALRAYNKTATDVDILTIRRGIWPLLTYARSVMDSDWNNGWTSCNHLVDAGMLWVNTTPAVTIATDFVITTATAAPATPVTPTTSSPPLPPLTQLSTPSNSSVSTTSTSSCTTESSVAAVAAAAAIATAAALASFTISPSTPSSSSIVSLSPPASTSAPLTPDASPIPAL